MNSAALLRELVDRIEGTNLLRCSESKGFKGWYDMWKVRRQEHLQAALTAAPVSEVVNEVFIPENGEIVPPTAEEMYDPDAK